MQARDTSVTPASDRVAFSLDEVAARFGVSTRHVRRLGQRGEMRLVKVGRKVMVLATDLDAYIEHLKAGEAA
ncbi:MAG TPA: helix-turn-helix domain-containing protein [Micromonosporaceae bacterium]